MDYKAAPMTDDQKKICALENDLSTLRSSYADGTIDVGGLPFDKSLTN